MEKSHGHEELERSFINQQSTYEKIYQKGLWEYVKGLGGIDQCFEKDDGALRCIDEGCPGGRHGAGSGILMTEAEAVAAFKGNVTEVTSHEGCGAAGLFAARNNLSTENTDAYGIEWSKKLAELLGVPYRHIPAEDMARPKEFHKARCLYYCGAESFDAARSPFLPPGFHVSRKMVGRQRALEDAEISVGIATGHHGFGEMIDENNPFVIVVVATNEMPIEMLVEELKPLVEKYGKRVRVEEVEGYGVRKLGGANC